MASAKSPAAIAKVLPRTIVYDPDLTLGLPAAVSAASGMNAIAHCVEGFWADGRTPVTMALASEAMRRFAESLPAVVADGSDREARAECLIAAWLSGTVLSVSTALHHKLAHVLGGLGLPHAETHAIILPHVTRFNLEAAPEAKARLTEALRQRDPADAIATMLKKFPIPQRLREVGFDSGKTDFVADEIAAAASRRRAKFRQTTCATSLPRHIDLSQSCGGNNRSPALCLRLHQRDDLIRTHRNRLDELLPQNARDLGARQGLVHVVIDPLNKRRGHAGRTGQCEPINCGNIETRFAECRHIGEIRQTLVARHGEQAQISALNVAGDGRHHQRSEFHHARHHVGDHRPVVGHVDKLHSGFVRNVFRKI